MAYCEVTEIREMLKDSVLNTIIGEDTYIEEEADREQQIVPIILNAIADAAGEVDGYLAKRYPTPLNPVPKVINKLTKDIVIYNLYSRIGIDENSEEKNFLNRYKSAIRFLELLAEGKVEVGAVDTAKAAQTGFSVQSNRRLFSRNNMRGM